MLNENDVDKSHFFMINGFVSRIKNDDKIYYEACKNDKCNKKVIADGDVYRCDNCGQTFDSCAPTYMMKVKISDLSGSLYVSFTRDLGNSVLGMTA